MRGFLLSIDALIAVSMLLLLAVFLSGLGFTYHSPELKYQRLYYAGKDLLAVLQELKINNLQDFPVIQYYMQEGVITSKDLDKSFLDIVGSLWAAGNVSDSRNMTEGVLGSILNGSKYGFEIIIGNTSIYSKNTTNRTYVARLSAIISGYDIGRPVSGHVANAYLTRLSKITSSFAYFGGYVGDGNVTRTLELPGDAVVTGAEIEANTGSPFNLYVNGNFIGSYTPLAGNMSADTWVICSGMPGCSDFVGGGNTIELNFTAPENSYIGGGYIKVTYNTSEPNTIPIFFGNQTATQVHQFPGISGIINLYSSFYVPGELDSVFVHLHYLSNYSLFMNIGNVTVFESNSTGEQRVNLTDQSIAGNLSVGGLGMDFLSNRTVPLRIGLKNISYMTMGTRTGDSVLVTDVSGSMDECAVYSVPYICSYSCIFGGPKSCEVGSPQECTGNVCGGTCFIPFGHSLDCNQTKLDKAKEADRGFVDIVLNESMPGNRVGLVSYEDGLDSTENLTDNKTVLYSEIDGYTAGGATCICCGINEAVDILVEQSNSSRRRTIVVMSDGEANRECSRQGTGDAKNDTIQAACDAYSSYNITVYTVGYGDDVDNETLNQTAECGNGNYYFSNATELAETFREIAEDILNASYQAQTIEISGNMSMDTVLYPDSHMEFEYFPVQKLGYGEVSVTLETGKFGGNVTSPKNASFFVPGGAKVLDAKVTSYSSRYWTDRLLLSNSLTGGWQKVFDLGIYGSDYTALGDPYIVYVPVNLVGAGENNSLSIDTAITPGNTTGGSPDDRLVYSLGVEGSVGYGNVFFSSQEAVEDAVQRLENKLAAFGISIEEGRTDSQSIAGVTSMWGPGIIEVRSWI